MSKRSGLFWFEALDPEQPYVSMKDMFEVDALIHLHFAVTDEKNEEGIPYGFYRDEWTDARIAKTVGPHLQDHHVSRIRKERYGMLKTGKPNKVEDFRYEDVIRHYDQLREHCGGIVRRVDDILHRVDELEARLNRFTTSTPRGDE